MIKIKKTDIVDEVTVCPYCMDDYTGIVCCGENHPELAYITKDGNCYLDNEIEIVSE